MITASAIISVEQYLGTVYRPDCDFIDGEVLERNIGEKPHSRLQKLSCGCWKALKKSAT